MDEPDDELPKEGQRRTFLPPADIACSLYSTFLGTQTVVVVVLTPRGHCGGKMIRGSVRVEPQFWPTVGGRAEKANFSRGIPVTAGEKTYVIILRLLCKSERENCVLAGFRTVCLVTLLHNRGQVHDKRKREQ